MTALGKADDPFKLQGKNILLTGAFGLFGKRLATAYYNQGANLVLCGHTAASIETWKTEAGKDFDSSRILIQQLEITETESIRKVVKSAQEKFGEIDVLVNNASIDSKMDESNIGDLNSQRFENFPIELVKQSVNVNLVGTVELTQYVCRAMIQQGHGNIINVGSIYSVVAPTPQLYKGLPGPPLKPVDYVISKSFIPNFTRYIAACYGEKNIRCNALAPHGVLDGHSNDFVKNFSALSPLGRMCTEDELDGPFLFLASPLSSYINGVTLVVDGGWTVW